MRRIDLSRGDRARLSVSRCNERMMMTVQNNITGSILESILCDHPRPAIARARNGLINHGGKPLDVLDSTRGSIYPSTQP